MAKAKEIPYGVSNFLTVMQQNMYYVDKTMFIPTLEDSGRFLFLIRPRRFGKSLFLDMLRAYYDRSMAGQFDELFGSLWIGSHPTELQGQYQVLFLDFSRATPGVGSLEDRFNRYFLGSLQDFCNAYEEYYSEEVQAYVRNTPTYGDALSRICNEASRKGYRLYLILDEYDNFTNNVLNEQGQEVYHALTHATGFYREVFKMFKGNFERILMMGVSPVTMDDVASGFNISTNISIDPQFNQLLGFSTDEVRTMLQYYQEQGVLKGNIEEMIAEMKPWYDNYCFAKQCLKTDPKMFNSDMVLHYLRERAKTGHTPEQMVDPNTRTDYTKMKKLLDLDHLDGYRKGVIRRIAEDGQIIANLYSSFPAQDLVKPEIFPSLLYYYGMLTIVGTRGDRIILGIPNNNVRIQYYDYILQMYEMHKHLDFSHLHDIYDAMAFDGDWRPAIEYIAEAYRTNSSVRSQIEGERNIQGFFTALLSQSAYYLTAPEIELNHGYCDLFLMPDHQRYAEVAHSYIIELKYLPTKDFEAKAETQWQEAVVQIHGYAEGAKVRQMIDGTQLHLLVIQFSGWDAVRIEEV